jgi:hypothetical protein
VRRARRDWTGQADGRHRCRSRVRTWRNRVGDRWTNLGSIKPHCDSTSELFVEPLESSVQALRTNVRDRRLAVRCRELLDQRRGVRDDFDVVGRSVVEQDRHARRAELVREKPGAAGANQRAGQDHTGEPSH